MSSLGRGSAAQFGFCFVILPIVTLAVSQPTPSLAGSRAPIWTGAYIGLHGGAAWADVEARDLFTFDTGRAAYGGHAGYNIALGNFVVGIEGDAAHAGSTTTAALAGGGTVTLETDWTGTLRGRFGYASGPIHFFATAGWAWTGTTLIERSGAGTTSRGKGTFNGLVYGVGAEAYVLPSISVRVDALRYDYGSERLSMSGGLSALRKIDEADTTVRLGVTLHFK
jgi:outer membrane immunogenic protein